MQKKSSFWNRLKKALSCLAIIFMLQGAILAPAAPPPAEASGLNVFDILQTIVKVVNIVWDAITWIASNALLVLQEAAVIDLELSVTEGFADLTTEVKKQFQGVIGAVRIASQGDVKHGQAEIDNAIEDEFMERAMESVGNNLPPKNQYACISAAAREVSTSADYFGLGVSRSALDTIAAIGRSEKSDRSGPRGAYQAYGARCGESKSGASYGNPIDGDEDCQTEEKTEDGCSFVDADLTPPNAICYMVAPKLGDGKKKAIKGTSTAEKMWQAKLQYIINAVGAVPSPLRGDNINTLAGRPQRAMYNHCAANQNALVAQCTDLLSFYTWPNCEPGQADKVCETQNLRCTAVTEKVVSKEFFRKCEKGLSPYHALLLDVMQCKGEQHNYFQAEALETASEQMEGMDYCSMAWDSLMDLVQQKHENCANAVEALADMDQCWGAVEAIGSGAVALADQEHYRTVSAQIRKAKPTKMHRIKVRRGKQMAPGFIKAADDLRWPKMVTQ